eukprot:5169033-Amphidinium_carterae.1
MNGPLLGTPKACFGSLICSSLVGDLVRSTILSSHSLTRSFTTVGTHVTDFFDMRRQEAHIEQLQMKQTPSKHKITFHRHQESQ